MTSASHRRRLLAPLLGIASLLGAGAANALPVQPADADFGWLFDDGAGAVATAHQGGTAGALQNGAGWSTDAPFAYLGNGSLSLDGADDFVDVAGLNGALDGLAAFSISLWIHSGGTSQNRAFFGGANPSGADTFGGRYDSAGWLNGNGATTDLIKFGLMIDGTNYQYESSGGYQTTQWQHVAFVWESGAGARLYVDGVLDTPTETSPGLQPVGGLPGVTGALSNQTRFLLGNGAKDVWSGEIDEAMVWRSALTPDEVEYLSQTSSAPAASPVPEPSTAVLVLAGILGLASRRSV